MRAIIIGGVAAGMSAASKLIRTNPKAEIVVYEKNGFLSYGACGLPYYMGGFNDDYRRMIARTQQQFDAMGIVSKLHHEVKAVDFNKKTVVVLDHTTGTTFEDHYDKLMISVGADSVVPPFPGKDMMGVHVLKRLEDGIFLREMARMDTVKNVVIVGGGYIGVECADAFLNLGKNVRLVEAAPRILTPFDEEMSEMAAQELISKGVALCLNEKVQQFNGDVFVNSVTTDKGTYPADLVIVAVGVRPSTGFLKDTGIRLAKNGAIVVDRQMRTSVPDVYAAGDCITVYNRITGEDAFIALGTLANKCGRIAGGNMAGEHQEFVGALGSAAIKVCELEMGRTGMGEADAKRLGIDYKTKMIRAYDHPAYYPNPTPITIKVIYEAGTRRLLGAQLAGEKGAALRTDVFATAIHAGMTCEDLGMTDLIYAPPFAGVWDAIQIACNAAK
ncbi:MAG: CoA-disulfide reductase [Lachnospiraceae bacterium]|nr:CoA-disulfide reductase [Candidatus Equihabitans merdae]